MSKKNPPLFGGDRDSRSDSLLDSEVNAAFGATLFSRALQKQKKAGTSDIAYFRPRGTSGSTDLELIGDLSDTVRDPLAPRFSLKSKPGRGTTIDSKDGTGRPTDSLPDLALGRFTPDGWKPAIVSPDFLDTGAPGIVDGAKDKGALAAELGKSDKMKAATGTEGAADLGEAKDDDFIAPKRKKGPKPVAAEGEAAVEKGTKPAEAPGSALREGVRADEKREETSSPETMTKPAGIGKKTSPIARGDEGEDMKEEARLRAAAEFRKRPGAKEEEASGSAFEAGRDRIGMAKERKKDVIPDDATWHADISRLPADKEKKGSWSPSEDLLDARPMKLPVWIADAEELKRKLAAEAGDYSKLKGPLAERLDVSPVAFKEKYGTDAVIPGKPLTGLPLDESDPGKAFRKDLALADLASTKPGLKEAAEFLFKTAPAPARDVSEVLQASKLLPKEGLDQLRLLAANPEKRESLTLTPPSLVFEKRDGLGMFPTQEKRDSLPAFQFLPEKRDVGALLLAGMEKRDPNALLAVLAREKIDGQDLKTAARAFNVPSPLELQVFGATLFRAAERASLLAPTQVVDLRKDAVTPIGSSLPVERVTLSALPPSAPASASMNLERASSCSVGSWPTQAILARSELPTANPLVSARNAWPEGRIALLDGKAGGLELRLALPDGKGTSLDSKFSPLDSKINLQDALSADKTAQLLGLVTPQLLGISRFPNSRAELIASILLPNGLKWEPLTPPTKTTSDTVKVVVQDQRMIDIPRPQKIEPEDFPPAVDEKNSGVPKTDPNAGTNNDPKTNPANSNSATNEDGSPTQSGASDPNSAPTNGSGDPTQQTGVSDPNNATGSAPDPNADPSNANPANSDPTSCDPQSNHPSAAAGVQLWGVADPNANGGAASVGDLMAQFPDVLIDGDSPKTGNADSAASDPQAQASGQTTESNNNPESLCGEISNWDGTSPVFSFDFSAVLSNQTAEQSKEPNMETTVYPIAMNAEWPSQMHVQDGEVGRISAAHPANEHHCDLDNNTSFNWQNKPNCDTAQTRILRPDALADRIPDQLENKDDRLALLIALEEERRQLDDAQEHYVVQIGDTLESIATEKFADSFLAALIYELNKAKIPIEKVDGATVYVLKPGIVLILPSRNQIVQWSDIRLEKWAQYTRSERAVDDRWALIEDISAGRRRKNIEEYLGPITPKPERHKGITMTVRLGETLRSIAKNHLALKDESLWPLLAKCNGLSMEASDDGTPIATIGRGQILVFPTEKEILEFRRSSYKDDSWHQTPRNALKAAMSKSDSQVTDTNAQAQNQSAALSLPDESRSPEQTNSNTIIEKLGNSCRMIQIHSVAPEAGASQLLVKLEILRGSAWTPVLLYEVCDAISQRRQFSADGNYTSVPIDLPKASIDELVVNDLRCNWRNYCNEYLESVLENHR